MNGLGRVQSKAMMVHGLEARAVDLSHQRETVTSTKTGNPSEESYRVSC